MVHPWMNNFILCQVYALCTPVEKFYPAYLLVKEASWSVICHIIILCMETI
jgi:hypothetical protein